MSDYHAHALEETLRRLASSSISATAIDGIAKNAPAAAAKLQQAILVEVPAFSRSRNPDLLPQLAEHGSEIVDEIVRLLRAGRLGRFEFVRAHARRRAEQRFPLEATLHAYRWATKCYRDGCANRH